MYKKVMWKPLELISDDDFDKNMRIIGLRISQMGFVYTKRFEKYLEDLEIYGINDIIVSERIIT